MLIRTSQIKYEELSTFSEVMAAGTAAALVPIKSITMRSRNDEFKYQNASDEPGPVCLKLLSTLQGIQRAKIPDTFGWLENVKQANKSQFEAAGEVTNGVNGNVDKLP